MTPTESREAALALSRERLARASSRLERVARDAAERIYHLKEEKRGLEKRLADLETLYAQERQNFDQRASLLTSVQTEANDRAKEFADLTGRLNDQERLLTEQNQTIDTLRSELERQAEELRSQGSQKAAGKAELADWKSKVAQLEERLEAASSERDALRAKIYDDERMNAQFVLHLTSDERDKAAKAIDRLIDQISGIESRALLTTDK